MDREAMVKPELCLQGDHMSNAYLFHFELFL